MDLNTSKTALQRYGFDLNDPLETWLEAAKIEVEDAYAWPWLIKTATVALNANTQTVSALLPDDCFKLYSVKDMTNLTFLHEKDMVGFERDIEDPTQTGDPSYYTVNQFFTVDGAEQIGIQLYPIPDAAVNLRVIYQSYTSTIIGLGGAAQLPGPSRLHFLYIMGAAYRGLQADNEEDRAASAQNQFDADLRRMVGKYSERVATFNTVQNAQGY